MGERDEDLERIREGLDHISEAVDELTRTQVEQGTRLEAAERSVQALATAINGSDTGKAAGLKTRIAVLEDREKTRREESKPAPLPAPPPAESALVQVETARAEVAKAEAAANKTKWETLAKWTAISGGISMGAKTVFETVLGALGGK